MSQLKMETLSYDPNIRWAKQRVRLHIRQWDYSAILETTVGGNCKGFDIFQCAIDAAWEELPTLEHVGVGPLAHVVLTNAAGDTLECEDEELRCEDWLAKMVVGIEIVSQEEAEKD